MKEKVPDNIIKELDVNNQVKITNKYKVKPIVETHQVKIPLPRKMIRINELEFVKGKEVELIYDEYQKKITIQL